MSDHPICLTDEQRSELLRKLLAGQPLEIAGIRVAATFKLEKFDGDYRPGKEPVEVIEGGDDRPTTVKRKENPDGA